MAGKGKWFTEARGGPWGQQWLGGWMGWASQEANGLPSSALMPRRISP